MNHIGTLFFKFCEAVYLILMAVVSHVRGQKVLQLSSSSFPCISFSGWPTADAWSHQTFRTDKVNGRYGRTAGRDASMELIVFFPLYFILWVADSRRSEPADISS